MTKKQVEGNAKRQRFSAKFKQQALLRAIKHGAPAAARDLGLQTAQLYAWRAQSQSDSQETEARQLPQSEAAQLKRELARLEAENALLKKAAAYFAVKDISIFPSGDATDTNRSATTACRAWPNSCSVPVRSKRRVRSSSIWPRRI